MLLERHKEMLDREKTEWQREASNHHTAERHELHVQGDLYLGSI